MSNNNFYSEDIKKRQASILCEMDNLGMQGYIDGGFHDEYKPFLNGITEVLRKRGVISPSFKATDMWYTDSRLCSSDEVDINRAYFNLNFRDSNYNGREITSLNYRVFPKNCYLASEETLSAILDECEKLIATIKKMMDESEKLPEINELMETFLKYAKKHVDNEKYTVEIEKGKLNLESDMEPYNCLVVRHKDNGEYHSSLVFSKSNRGKYSITQRVPLCGQSTIEFSLDNAEDRIKEIINF